MRLNESNCFVCLNPSRNRVCRTCKCYAHHSCWGKYVTRNNDNIVVFNQDGLVLLCKYSIPCPICNTQILRLPPTTRSKTKSFRFNEYTLDAIGMMAIMNEEGITSEEKIERRHIVMKMFKKMKRFIKSNKQLSDALKNLCEWYHHDGWKIANQYYMDLFGEQINTN